MNRNEIVLGKLLKSKVTCYDFIEGCHYKEAIRVLRNRGHDIRMTWIDDPKGIKRRIGLYSYHGKKDKVEQRIDYQSYIESKLADTLSKNVTDLGLDGIIMQAGLFAYSKLIKKARLNKKVLDFINGEITNFWLQIDKK